MEKIMISKPHGFVLIRRVGENTMVSITASGHKNYGLILVISKKLASIISEKL